MAFPTVLDPSSTHACGRAKARTPDSLVELTTPLTGFSVFLRGAPLKGALFHINKKAPLQDAFFLAEQVGFEPTGPEGLTDFESASL